MTKGTKTFRVIICILLGLTMLWTGFVSYAFFYFAGADVERRDSERYGLFVGGIDVTAANAGDILGNGTASYDAKLNTLTLKNATIEYHDTLIYSEIDLKIELIGENKLVCKDKAYLTAIYASDGILRKDLSLDGTGSLEISYENVTEGGTGIIAEDLWIGSDVTITTPDGSDISNAITCTSSLTLRNKANVTINNGAARSSTAVDVRGNAVIENGSALNIAVKSGATNSCTGLSVDGDLLLGRDVTLNVSVGDEIAEISSCIDVSGLITVARNSNVTATASKAIAMECHGSIDLYADATVTAATAAEGADIFCSGAVINRGATVDATVESLVGIFGKSEN